MRRSVALILALFTIGPAASAGPEPDVTCGACLVVEGDRTHFERAGDEGRANASTTKMVTALVALDHLAPGDEVRVPEDVTGVTSTVELQPGDTYEVRDLVAAMMLESWNDAAITLADATSGSQPAFVAAMNGYAAGLGLTDTAFVNPHGLDAPGHYSTARDLAEIARVVLAERVLADIVARVTMTIEGPSGPIDLTSRNELLGTYRGAIGVKTGQTLQAGNVLVAAARRGGRTLIAVVMGSDDSFSDARRLLDLGFAIRPEVVLAREGTPAGAIVFDGVGSVAVALGEGVRGPHDPEAVSYGLVLADDLALPVDEGRSVGMITVEVDGEVVRRVPAVAATSLDVPEEGWGTSFFASLLGLFEPVAGVL